MKKDFDKWNNIKKETEVKRRIVEFLQKDENSPLSEFSRRPKPLI